MNIHDVLRDGHEMFQESLLGLADADWQRIGVVGQRSVKEIVAQAAGFEKMLVELLETLSSDRDGSLVARFAADPERFGVDEIQARRHLSPAYTFAEYDRTYRHAMALLRRLPAKKLHEKGLLPWYGEQYDLEDFLVHAFYGHKREYSAHVALYREQLEAERDARECLPVNKHPQPAPAGAKVETDWSFAARLWQPLTASYTPAT